MVRALRSTILGVVSLLAACSSPSSGERGLSANLGFSALPNIGVTAGAGQVFRETPTASYSFELQATLQPLDDEDIHDDGNPSAGDFTQFQMGAKGSWPSDERRSWTGRAGVVWFRAEGEPNIVQEPGDYIGLYFGAGFETRLSEHLVMGPDVVLMLVSPEKDFDVRPVPQFSWRFTWSF